MASTTTTPSGSDAASRTFVLASRSSKLAQVQTFSVLSKLASAAPSASFDTLFMKSGGDVDKTSSLYLLGASGKAFWTAELNEALDARAADFLVHSLKDVPTVMPAGSIIGAVPAREDPGDCVVFPPGSPLKSLDELKEGSVVGTGSVRRIAQLRRLYPGHKFQDCRGNIDTRLAKLDSPTSPFAAIVLAKAGLLRIDLGHRISADLPNVLHAVGQGALGVEVRGDDEGALDLCKQIKHIPTMMRVQAERACLRVLEGGCSVPVGDRSTYDEQGNLSVTGCVTSLDGTSHVQTTLDALVSGDDEKAIQLGEDLAKKLIDGGAKAILDDIKIDRETRARSGQTNLGAELKTI